MIIAINAAKASDKIQHPFLIKNSDGTRNKWYIWQTYMQYHGKWGKIETISS
jgi:hypothetical protein